MSRYLNQCSTSKQVQTKQYALTIGAQRTIVTKNKTIAIIGAGIAGLSTAYQLHTDYDITVFEQHGKLGGHTDTHEFEIDSELIRVDSGFIVFCPDFYPNFSQMLKDLGVPTKPTNMSFSARNFQTGLAYNATSLNKLFCQRKNLLSPRFYRMLFDLARFYTTAPQLLQLNDHKTSIQSYLTAKRYSSTFSNDHLYPMISALWSATPERVALFPIHHLVEYMSSHGMLKLLKRPEWRVVKGGSDRYIDALKSRLQCQWQIGTRVLSVVRNSDGATVKTDQGEATTFDAVVFATHADQALNMLHQPSTDERETLGAIEFETNDVVIHTDTSIMHPNKAAWASWNTEVPHSENPNSLDCCTANYWMNSLQGLDCKTDIFVTLNSHQRINKHHVLAERQYRHPIFTADSVSAQKRHSQINGKNRSYFVGAYWGWAFHEDGARSAKVTSDLIRQQLA